MRKQSIDFRGLYKGGIKNIEGHNLRNGKLYNENIDVNKSEENIIFENVGVEEKLKEIESKKIVGGLQKKSQLFTGFVIQAGNKNDYLEKKQAIKYFEKSIKFIKKKFGEDCIAHAVAHFDETTPHLHIIISNLKKENEKYYCSSKRMFEYQGLSKLEIKKKAKELDTEFFKKVSKKFNFEKPRQDFSDGKVSVREWKLENALKESTLKVELLEKKELELKQENLELKEQEKKLELKVARRDVSISQLHRWWEEEEEKLKKFANKYGFDKDEELEEEQSMGLGLSF